MNKLSLRHTILTYHTAIKTAVLFFILLLLSIYAVITTPVFANSGKHPPAVEFRPDLPWLNVSRPLKISELKGKVVILDFWTYGCINCIHVLEDLRKLEHKYGNKLVVIGIHTPKFDNEKNLETLRRIIVRYDIQHPVVNDIDSYMGMRYGMRAWPTQFVIDPAGRVLGKVEGENNYEVLVGAIDKLLKKYAKELNDKPIPMALEKKRFAKTLLAAPGKIAVSNNYVAISDSLHHRIILADHKGNIKKIIGGKQPGFKNGVASKARFKSPQGLAFSDKGLYVADTGNHSIRFINFKNWRVSTVAGNGKNDDKVSHRVAAYKGTAISLRSPWALALKDKQLYIAMAGNHQIWRYDTDKKTISQWAGSGRESIDDGPLMQASFSQPSGLSFLGDKLYVADAEDSAVRTIDLNKHRVKTLVGSGLFDFGDKDGTLTKAKLQHVLGVAAIDDKLIYIADTYNHKLKLLDLKKHIVSSVAGTGKPGKGAGKAGSAGLNEPGGIAVLNGKILIADTNNNRIMQYDPGQKLLTHWKLLLP